jgi:cellulose synthase/poly-beta-1,6-N-acetylglucosamine synthase-like glycosyltransferase
MDWHFFLTALSWLYTILNVTLACFSFNILFLLILAIIHRKDPIPDLVYRDEDLPTVLVQLPVYNERYVIERLIDAVVAMDYPEDKIIIQVLDDSTDDTTNLAQKRAILYADAGRNVHFIHRTDRSGYKAGALAVGMNSAPGEIIVIFDADFVPPTNFLRSIIPMFLKDPKLGVVQARWDHINLDQNPITHFIALALDVHFVVDQIARSRAHFTMNFNGSCCSLRRSCIDDAGGWQSDTLVEDLDLSYRAQINGWRVDYRVDVAVPSELPASILAFKLQQFRWAKGTTQAVKKLLWKFLHSSLPPSHKFEGLIHLTGYFASPLMVLTYLLCLPVVYFLGHLPYNSTLLGFAVLILPLAVVWSQIALRAKWWKSFLYFPLLFLIGIGISLTISQAIWDALIGHKNEWLRTPKFSDVNQQTSAYALPLDKATWSELLLAIYGFFTAYLAFTRAPSLVPFILLYAFAFLLTATLGFLHAGRSQETKHSHQSVDFDA